MGLRARQAHLAESIRLIFISLSPFAARLEVVWDCTVAPRRRRRLSLRCAVVHAMAASGMEDERVSEEVRREEGELASGRGNILGSVVFIFLMSFLCDFYLRLCSWRYFCLFSV